ncbi:hypothetical protein Ocin01_18421 [Orchesella cincta]|uniref:Uncharacterized protein n=1 Tax=Orchesella cincta TaxID=48709 RepID=A0A1D2M5S4_ORCCI|nr:hypothetical protein Ocin01_18421 [Orchesella cincta]
MILIYRNSSSTSFYCLERGLRCASALRRVLVRLAGFSFSVRLLELEVLSFCRDASPAPSGVTLFEPINNESTPNSNKRTEKEKPAKRTSTRRKAEAQPQPAPDNRKKSKKNYDKSLIGEWQNGNGA